MEFAPYFASPAAGCRKTNASLSGACRTLDQRVSYGGCAFSTEQMLTRHGGKHGRSCSKSEGVPEHCIVYVPVNSFFMITV